MIETQRETNDDTVKGATTTMEKVTISSKDIGEFMNRFDSAEAALIHSVKKVEDFKRDVNALIESMNNLFQENFIPLMLMDVEVDVTVHTCGKLSLQSRLGNRNSAENLMRFMHDSVREDD